MDSTSGITSIKCLYVDSMDRLWIGTNDNGIAVMEQDERWCKVFFENFAARRPRLHEVDFEWRGSRGFDKVSECIQCIKKLYSKTKNMTVFEETLSKRKKEREERAKKLSYLLNDYDAFLDLKDRRDALMRMLEYQNRLNLYYSPIHSVNNTG